MLLKLIHEDKIIKPIANEQETPTQEIPEEVLTKTFESMINDIIQNAWGLIANTNSAITSIDFDYLKENKDKIIELLNSVVDDITINIGVLYKVSELVNEKRAELLASGEAKANEIVTDIEDSNIEDSAEIADIE